MSDSDLENTVVPVTIRSKKEKNLPKILKIEKFEGSGEKSPNADSVYDLCMIYEKKYQHDDEKPNGAVNVHLDQLPSEVQTGFLEKLKKLSVGNKDNNEESFTSSAGRFIKNLVQRRSNWKGKQSSASNSTIENAEKTESRLDNFGRPSKKNTAREVEKPKRKEVARRLNFSAINPIAAENQESFRSSESKERKECRSSLPINKINRNVQGPRGSLETASDSSLKIAESQESLTVSSTANRDRRPSFIEQTMIGNGRPKNFQRNPNKKENSFQANWTGELPPRDYTSPTFSKKIFVGGVPWDITEAALKESFGEFGSCAVEWPGQEARYRSGQQHHLAGVNSFSNTSRAHSKITNGQGATGYVYMIFEDERAVGALLHECSQEIGGAGEWYFKIRAQRSKSTEIRQVQIIPWVTSDSLHCDDDKILEYGVEPKRTVFVGALHGMMTAQVLHHIMEDCFGNVECVQLDTDKFKYPIGSGRVTFREHGAYFKAIEFGYLLVHTSKFKKRVQIDPFLESTTCMVCNIEMAHCFCRNRNCFKYYCNTCWAADHKQENPSDVHVPVIVPSSATKPFNPINRRSTMYCGTPSPVKTATTSTSTTFHPSSQQAPFVVRPMFVGPSIYGYPPTQISMSQHSYVGGSASQSVSNQSFDSFGKCSSVEAYCSDRDSLRTMPLSPMNGMPTGPLYVNTMVTPQKKSPAVEQQLSSPFCGTSCYGQPAYLSPVMYTTTASSSTSPIGNSQMPITTGAGPFYGGNFYYGYMPNMMARNASNGNCQTNCNMYHSTNINY